jgi:hypothetical protein
VKKPTLGEIIERLDYDAYMSECAVKVLSLPEQIVPRQSHARHAAIYREAIRRLNEHEKQRRRK